MKTKIKTLYPAALIMLFVLMAMSAVTENSKGVFVPGFKEQFMVGDRAISYMIIGTSAAYMLASFLGGYLCEKIGQKLVLISGITVLFITLILMSISKSFLMLSFWIGLNSAGLGLVGIASNTLMPVLVLSMQSLVMNFLHFFYGLGSTIGQRSFGLLMGQNVSWRTLYVMVACVFAVLLLMTIFIPFPKPKRVELEHKLSFKEIISNKLFIFYMIALGSYVFAETGTANWLVNYLKYTYSFNESKGSVYISAFFLVFAVGRLLGGFVVEKFGAFKVVITSLTLALVLYTLGLLFGQSALILIALSGIFFAVAFPTIVATVSKVFPVSSSYITGILITSSSFQSMLLNYLMGLGNTYLGADKAIYIIPICLLTSIVFNIMIYNNTRTVLVNNRQ